MTATTYQSNSNVEKKHLLGQECAKTRSRGRRLRADRLSRSAYVKEAITRNRKRSEYAVGRGLAAAGAQCNKYRRVMTKVLLSSAVNKRKVREKAKEAIRKLRTPRQTASKVSGFQEFRKANWDPAVRPFPYKSEAALNERRRLRELWHACSEADVQHWVARASARQDPLGVASLSVDNNDDFGSGYRHRKARKVEALQRFGAIANDRLWSGGLGIDALWQPLKPSLVDVTTTAAELERQCALAFDYRSEPVPNPPGTAKCETTCSEIHGGALRKRPRGWYVFCACSQLAFGASSPRLWQRGSAHMPRFVRLRLRRLVR